MPILLQRINLKNRLMPFLFTLFLAGCTTNFFGSSFTGELKKDANASSEFYMNKIGQTQDIEDQQTYKLLAARVLVAENKVAQAQSLLNELTELNPEQLLDKTLIDADIAAVKGQNNEAENLLRDIDLTQLSASQVGRYYAVKARVAENQNAIIDALKARIEMDQVLSDVQRKQENNDRTWALLRRTNRGLIHNTSDEGNLALAGWLALARAYNDNLNQATQLSQALQSWKSSYPSHSAAYLFPTELQGLFNFQQTALSQIGLLLPLSGNGQVLGNTIKSGFDAAKGEDTTIQVQVYDTVATPMNEIIEQARQAGVRALIGPLLKQNVDVILNNPSAIQGLDVLALNSTPNARAIGQVCYYGLSPEDEAESAANKMWRDGIREPMVAVPQNDLGQRTATAFNVRWQQLSGTDANIKYYNQAGDVGVALQGQSVQGLYIVAKSEELSDLKSVIDNSGNNIKLYASSRSNSSNNGPEYRLLMNGLQFSDIPFFKDTDSAQYQKVATATNNDYSLMRLYAMGADSWLLINHFNELRQVPGYNIDGLTGKLSAGPNCNIERDMTWFQYQNGGIQVLN
ncbi:penicillin-binding protein activator [Aggregatibacter actinomycetemcomitans]|uniref:penicillin-binding protein activator n=1 Tax=Aggregatibacter actinomycetemcomitans TaxID=714 RepID=UPI00197B3568|nr:penicillin-binding protein activator [Aggregatibacter actinomycetemcomitans]MBN6070758.1 penicillin-binding protein activator [Aggregatibacter actinomycetemcomitans]